MTNNLATDLCTICLITVPLDDDASTGVGLEHIDITGDKEQLVFCSNDCRNIWQLNRLEMDWSSNESNI